jgi:hypothetical protein
MTADKETFDSRSELDLQGLLLDVAAVVAATEPDRIRDGSAPDRISVVSLGNLRPGG